MHDNEMYQLWAGIGVLSFTFNSYLWISSKGELQNDAAAYDYFCMYCMTSV